MKSYTAYFNRFTIKLPRDCVVSCSRQGHCDKDVEFWNRRLNLDLPTDQLRAELKEYGAWDSAQLDDHNANLHRIIWIAACDINENRVAFGRFPTAKSI